MKNENELFNDISHEDDIADDLPSTFKYILELNNIEYKENEEGGIEISYSDEENSLHLNLNEDNSVDLDNIHFETLKDFIDYIKEETILKTIPEEELDVLDECFSKNNLTEDLDEESEEDKINNSINESIENKNNLAIKKYRSFANLNDDDTITEDNLDSNALNRCSCYLNYDVNELKEVLLGR